MRTSRSPYFAEGTDINYDIPSEYPIPNQCQVIDGGVPVELRYLPNSAFIKKQDQMKKENRPERVPYDDDGTLTFKFGRLMLDDKRHKTAIDYLDKAPWNKKNEDSRPYGSKIIFEEYDEQAILKKEIAETGQMLEAIKAVMAMDETKLNNVYIIATAGTAADAADASFEKKQRHLINVAQSNPGFILNGIQSVRNDIVISVTNAINKKLVDMTVNGWVTMRSATNETQYEQWIEMSDSGGQEAKMNRLVDYLQTDEGAKQHEVLKNRLKYIR